MASSVDSPGSMATNWEKRDGHLSTLPFDLDEHIVFADVFRRHAEDLDAFTF